MGVWLESVEPVGVSRTSEEGGVHVFSLRRDFRASVLQVLQ
jgi:hypothetical protein